MEKKYFSYGLNMDSREMAIRCRGASEMGVAILEGYSFRINARGVATVVETEGRVVYGVLWNLSEKNLQSLDEFEGVSSGHYCRVKIKVIYSGGPVDAEIYLATENRVGNPRKGYLERIVAASVKHCFPEKYIMELKKWTDV